MINRATFELKFYCLYFVNKNNIFYIFIYIIYISIKMLIKVFVNAVVKSVIICFAKT